MAHQLNKGKIRDNALKALVRSNLFRHKTERKKKGKGSYNRQAAKKWRDGFEQPSRFDLYRYTDNRLSPPCPPPIPYRQLFQRSMFCNVPTSPHRLTTAANHPFLSIINYLFIIS